MLCGHICGCFESGFGHVIRIRTDASFPYFSSVGGALNKDMRFISGVEFWVEFGSGSEVLGPAMPHMFFDTLPHM